jgi:hypothetical protein
MPKLYQLLRRLDAALLSVGGPAEQDAHEAVWPAALAVLGALVVVAGAMLLGTHALLQLTAVAAGMLMTTPFLQDRWDKAAAAVRE